MAAARRGTCTCDDCAAGAPGAFDHITLGVALAGFALLPGRALFQLIFGGIS